MAERDEGIGDEARLRRIRIVVGVAVGDAAEIFERLEVVALTPSPSAYMRPSFHCASGWPFSAAYSSEFTAFAASPALSQLAPERNASIGVIGGAAANASLGFAAVERQRRRGHKARADRHRAQQGLKYPHNTPSRPPRRDG